MICGQKKRARGKKLPKINSCVVWEKGKSFSLTTHANRIDYCLCVKKEKVPGTRSFVFIFRRSRTRARASNRLRVRSVKILCSFSRGEEKKTDKQQPTNRFFIASCRKDLKFPNLFAKAKNENESQESEDDRFHRSKTFRAFAFGGCSDSNVPPNEHAAQSFSRSVGFLSLSP